MLTLLDAAARASIEARVRQMRPDSSRQWGRMTPHQAICHMSDALRMALNEREVAPIPGRLKPVVRFIALWVPLRWPGGRITTVPEAEQGRGGTVPTHFEQDRAELIMLLARFCDARPGGRCSTHPIFGPMRPRDWDRWGFLHMDHHLRQFGH